MGRNVSDLIIPSDCRITAGAEAGWNDLIGQVIARATGPGNPTWSQMGSSPFYGYSFAVNDAVWVVFHFNHDMSFNSELSAANLYVHAHWTTSGTATESVKWEFTYTMAKAFGQGEVFDVAGGGTAVTIEEAASGTAWEHMTSEIATPIDISSQEPDVLMLCRIRRVTNGGSDNADTVFLLTSDCHYQVERVSTKNRVPNFYE